MPIDVTEMTPGFCAEVGGADITKPIAPEVFKEIRDAFDTYSVLIFRDQRMDDDMQVAFSRYFGVPEIGGGANPAAGTPFSRQSNLDIKTGDIIPPMTGACITKKGTCFGIWTVPSRPRHPCAPS